MQQTYRPTISTTTTDDEPVLDVIDIKLVGALLDAFMEADFENKRIEGVGDDKNQ